MQDEQLPGLGQILLAITRVWVPLAIAIAGVVMIVLGHGHYKNIVDPRSLDGAVGVSLLIVALIVWMINWLYRLSLRSNEEREAEERAREEFARTGRWPGEE